VGCAVLRKQQQGSDLVLSGPRRGARGGRLILFTIGIAEKDVGEEDRERNRLVAGASSFFPLAHAGWSGPTRSLLSGGVQGGLQGMPRWETGLQGRPSTRSFPSVAALRAQLDRGGGSPHGGWVSVL